ncbi:MAG: hypothetical protein Q7T05_03570 [Dehalococcoidia bacterium]|nr:hypothetical protein [Dehalococcoidia bacterium]
MFLIGIALALFFFVEWLLTTATLGHPVWLPPLWLVHIVFWVMIVLVLGGAWKAMSKK